MSSSATPVSQVGRILSLDTPLGQDVLLIEGFVGSESISGLFTYELELLADLENRKDQSVNFAALIGKGATVTLGAKNGYRYFHGMIRRFVEGYQTERFANYRMELVPWTWLLTLKSNLRIFQDKSVIDIIKEIFGDVQSSHSDLVNFRDATTANYEKWDYCVQYRETDFNFVSRLMEKEGIFYFFEHENGKHTLVLADEKSVFQPCPVQSKFRFGTDVGRGEWEDVVTHFEKQEEIRQGKYTLRDYHFELPSKNLEKKETTVINQGNNSSLEMYDFPGDYSQRFNKPGERLGMVEQVGEKLARHRMLEEEVPQAVLNGDSHCRNFVPGFNFELSGHRSGINGKYVLTALHHTAKQKPSYFTGDFDAEPYSNTFVCIPDAATYHPRRVTPKPVVQGPHTAVVTVKSGEESWLDKYGRVRIQFPWDREGQDDENSTCWVRVAQPWAGNTWGVHFWPRVGQEVVVEFLEGDPDRPIITGSVYNASQMPPYALPDNYTRSGVKTRSSKNGGASDYNELRFEDKKDDEQIFFNAQKDMDWRVEKESREFIGANRHLIVKSSQFESVDGDKQTQVKGKHIESVTGDTSVHLSAKFMEQVDSDHSAQVGGDQKVQVTGNDSLTVGQNRKVQIGSNDSITVSQNRNSQIGGSDALSATQAVYINGGMNVVIQAGMQLTLIGPGGFVDIGPAGVSIQGTMVLINSGGAPGSPQPASPDSPSSPDSPESPKDPDTADDGSKGGKLNQ